ncbi:MAG: Na+/H+ antiporter NhaA [Acidimicrobiia bacterium]|nr:Na+/H+ antiporter NhaA [Acidimicrobiia bacterium]
MAHDELPTQWLDSDRFIPKRFVRPALAFTHTEASSGIILLIMAILALVWANAPFGETYEQFWETHFDLTFGPLHLEETFRDLINDGFMAIFFFVVGLEIKRELVLGELRDPKAAALPAIAALGGMIAPALIYVAFVAGGEGLQGWGIPMATDIAFSVGVVALLGSRVPVGAKLFLLALAIADDIGAITVIAIFYTDDLSMLWLSLALGGLAFTYGANRVGIRSLAFYIPVGIATWFFLLESGVHATLAGVALGLLTPARPLIDARQFDNLARRVIDRYPVEDRTSEAREKVDEEARLLARVATESMAPLNRLEYTLHNWSSYVIVPVFALANAGVRFEGVGIGETLAQPIALGVTFGLLAGKLGGVTLFTWVAVKLGWGKLPKHTTWDHVIGMSLLAGIGFTVALFIAGLAFPDHPELADLAKVGIFAGSLASGVAGYLWLRFRGKPRGTVQPGLADAEIVG